MQMDSGVVMDVNDFIAYADSVPASWPPLSVEKGTQVPADRIFRWPTDKEIADVRHRVEVLMEVAGKNDPLVRRWSGDRTGLNDTSRSSFDKSLGALLKHRFFNAIEMTAAMLICNDTCEHSAAIEKQGQDDTRYFDRIFNNTFETGFEQIEVPVTDSDGETATVSVPKDTRQGVLIPGMVILPNDHMNVNTAAEEMSKILAGDRNLFVRGGQLVELVETDDGAMFEPVTDQRLRSALSDNGRTVYAYKVLHNDLVTSPKQCPADAAKLLLKTPALLTHLPHIRMVVNYPILVEDDGKAVVLKKGYNPQAGGVFVRYGRRIPDVPVNDAVTSLISIANTFRFHGDGDLSRALAAMITPTLKMGGMLKTAPQDLGLADHPQTGKTYLFQCIHALYGESPYIIAQRQGGVGSLDESIGQALMSGRPFILLDNVRGKLDSAYLESIITSQTPVAVRAVRKGEALVNKDHVTIQLTSNGLTMTPDIGARSSVIYLQKHEEGHQFRDFGDGDLLDHINSKQGYYLGCIFAVVRAWIDEGKPLMRLATHERRKWSRIMDWIVQHIFDGAPLMEGSAEHIVVSADQDNEWLVKIAHALDIAEMLGDWVKASDIASICMTGDKIVPPRSDTSRALDTQTKMNQAVGRQFKAVFGNEKSIYAGDAVVIHRQEGKDAKGKRSWSYQFNYG